MHIWPRNLSIRPPLLVLGSVELAIAYLSVLASCGIYHGGILEADFALGSLHLKASIVAILVLSSLVSMGLYQFHQRLYFREVFARVAVGIGIGAVFLAAFYFVVPIVALPPYFLSIALLFSFLGILLTRLYFFHNVDTNAFRRRTLIYGAGEKAKGIADLRRRADRRGFQVIGCVPAGGDLEVSQGGATGPLICDRSLVSIVDELTVDEIVIAMDDRRGNLPLRDLLDCKLKGVNVIDIVEFLERESHKVRVDLVNPSWLVFSPGFRASRLRKVTKRIFDFVVSAIGLLILWPILLLVALAIKVEDGIRAPAIFTQIRIGQYGGNFAILKFRSMRENAEDESGAVWAEENDPRVTRVGRFLRKVRLDEIPQLINVLLGEMSLVGPRPERPEFVDSLAETIPYYQERHTAKPGITGWAQLRYPYGSSEEDTVQKLQYDLYYVKNHSLVLDITIVLQTLEVVIWGKGAR